MVLALLIYQILNHKIKSKLKKQTILGYIYIFSKIELKILQKYLEKILKKRFIKKSKLLARYLIIFVLKKNEILYLYIDYLKLNNITIRNSLKNF